MIYPIVIYGNEVLRKQCEEIAPDYPEVKKLVEDMFQTLGEAEGVGLAAPQIGKDIRLFIVDCTPWAEEDPSCADYKRAFVNPEIYEFSEEKKTYNEGCLSFPGIHADVARSLSIRMRYMDTDFVEHDDRHDTQGLKRGVELIEHDVPFDVWRAWARDCQMCWSGADFGLVIGGTAWGSSNSKTGCSTSHVGNARQNRNGTGGFARPEESGSGPQGYGIGKLGPAEWRRTSARRGCHRRQLMPRLRSRLRSPSWNRP